MQRLQTVYDERFAPAYGPWRSVVGQVTDKFLACGLQTTLFAPVSRRPVVLTIPKRLRAYCLYRRRLLGAIARLAARTLTGAIRTLTGDGGRATVWRAGQRAGALAALFTLATGTGVADTATITAPDVSRGPCELP